MKQYLYGIYQYLYENYVEQIEKSDYCFKKQFIIKAATEIKEAIDTEISKASNLIFVRPDARYFLLLNYHQMILIPLILFYGESETEIIRRDKVVTGIREDIRFILNTFLNSFNVSNNKEFSSHSIINILKEQWKNLKINNLNIWSE